MVMRHVTSLAALWFPKCAVEASAVAAEITVQRRAAREGDDRRFRTDLVYQDLEDLLLGLRA